LSVRPLWRQQSSTFIWVFLASGVDVKITIFSDYRQLGAK
jgi:hypothetical protein